MQWLFKVNFAKILGMSNVIGHTTRKATELDFGVDDTEL
jgi:hypothetical protein